MAAVLRQGGGVAHQQGAIRNETRSGRFAATAALTEMQRNFVLAYVRNGLSATDAARQAGYAHPRTVAYELTRNSAVAAAIRAERTALIETEGANLAWRTLREVMEDKQAKPEVRVRAAVWTLEASGHGRAAGPDSAAREAKPLSEMTIAELEAFVSGGADRLRALHEQQAKTIDAEPAVLIDARDDARDAPADPPAEPDDTA